MFKNLTSLKAYQMAYRLALEIYERSKRFPKEEQYSLTDQIRRSSRSVCTNIGEAYRKRLYEKHFISKLSDADGECTETLIWLNFAKDFQYITEEEFKEYIEQYEQVGNLIGYMMSHPEKFK